MSLKSQRTENMKKTEHIEKKEIFNLLPLHATHCPCFIWYSIVWNFNIFSQFYDEKSIFGKQFHTQNYTGFLIS